MSTVSIRYIVDDVDEAQAFYVRRLGFRLDMQPNSVFAMLSRGDLRLVLVDARVECLDCAGWPALVIKRNNLYRPAKNATLCVQLIGREFGRLHNCRRDDAVYPAEADRYGNHDRFLLLRPHWCDRQNRCR